MKRRQIDIIFTLSYYMNFDQTQMAIRIHNGDTRQAEDYEHPYRYDVEVWDLSDEYTDPAGLFIAPVEELAKHIDQPDCLPNPPVLYSYKDEHLGVDVINVTLREVVKALLEAAAPDYQLIGE